MAKANFKSKSFSETKMSGSLREHNERDFDELPSGLDYKQAIAIAKEKLRAGEISKMPHYAPRYLLPEEHHLGNESFVKMTVDDVKKEYMETTKWGQKHGKFHHKSEPFREAIVHFEKHHTMDDLKRLSERLENELNIQTMYIHMHKDEGHITEDGEVKYNFHAHYGFTNIKNGKTNYFENIECGKAQDICAEVLKMERGKKGSDAIAMDHRQFRHNSKITENLNKDLKKSENNNSVLNDEINESFNAELNLQSQVQELSKKVRSLTKENSKLAALTGQEKAKQSDYQAIKKAKDSQDIENLRLQLERANARNKELEELITLQKKLDEETKAKARFLDDLEDVANSNDQVKTLATKFIETNDLKLEDTDSFALLPSGETKAKTFFNRFEKFMTNIKSYYEEYINKVGFMFAKNNLVEEGHSIESNQQQDKSKRRR